MNQNRAKIRAKRRKSKQEGAKRVASDLHQKNLEAKKRRAEKKKFSARQAEEEPTPAPTARAYFLSQM